MTFSFGNWRQERGLCLHAIDEATEMGFDLDVERRIKAAV